MFVQPNYVTQYHWGRKDAFKQNLNSMQLACIKTKGFVQVDEQGVITTTFHGGQADYLFTYVFNPGVLANTYGARFRLDGWCSIKYIAIGYTHNNAFQHVKIHNLRQGHWLDFAVCHHELAFLLQNKWKKEQAVLISDLCFFIKGEPNQAASISVDSLSLGLKRELDVKSVIDGATLNKKLSELTVFYWQDFHPEWISLVNKFSANGDLPITTDSLLVWSFFDKKPEKLETNVSFKFSWHALQSVAMLLVSYRKQNKLAHLFSARELVAQWLESSFFNVDDDQKYTWYDHGVAERTLVFIELWQAGIEHQFDYRFMARLTYALVKHAELLQSETFYAFHQPYRYHNHAWFQDIALVAAGIGMSHFAGAGRWVETGLERLYDQLKHLIHREAGYAVFVENSIGYHQGVQRLISFAGELETLAGKGQELTSVAEELDAWSTLLTYSEQRTPAQGDTFRQPNPAAKTDWQLPEYWKPQKVVLPQAGYAIQKGGKPNRPWMFGLLATNLNATHKHEDDLSFFLWLDGIEWLVDPSFMSHEYNEATPAYLRSAKAHNMLAVSGVAYSTKPQPQRVEISEVEATGKAVKTKKLSINGHNRSCAGYAIHRHIECQETRGLPQITCTDVFETLQLTTEPSATVDQPNHSGILSFHFGDGVSATLVTHEKQHQVELTHPASELTLVIALQYPTLAALPKAVLEESTCGLGFMQQVDTQALRILLNVNEVCHWTLKTQ